MSKQPIPVRMYREFRKQGHKAQYAADMARDLVEFERLGGTVEWVGDEYATLRDENHDEWCTHRIDDDEHWEHCDRCTGQYRYRRNLSCNHEIEGVIAKLGEFEASCWGIIDPDGDYKHDYRKAMSYDEVYDVLCQYRDHLRRTCDREHASIALIPAFSV